MNNIKKEFAMQANQEINNMEEDYTPVSYMLEDLYSFPIDMRIEALMNGNYERGIFNTRLTYMTPKKDALKIIKNFKLGHSPRMAVCQNYAVELIQLEYYPDGIYGYFEGCRATIEALENEELTVFANFKNTFLDRILSKLVLKSKYDDCVNMPSLGSKGAFNHVAN